MRSPRTATKSSPHSQQLENLTPAKDGFRKRFGFKKKNIKTGEAASANREVADQFPDAMKKISEEKGYLPEQVFNADESALFWKKCHKGHLLVRKKVSTKI